MSNIHTSIELNDGVTNVLNSMCAGVNRLIGGFTTMQNVIGRSFDTNSFNAFREQISSATSQMGMLENEARHTSQTIGRCVGLTNWRRTLDFDVFGGIGGERFKSEVDEITKQMQSVLTQQEHIKRKALGMDLLPRSAVSDIVETDNKVKTLISNMNMLKNVDISFLNKNQQNNFNAEYENMRKSLTAIRQLQNDMNVNASRGDISGVNNGFNQIKSIVEQTEMRLRSFKDTLGQISNFSWQSIKGIDIFNTKGLERAKQEILSARNMTDGLIQKQQQLTSNALKMKMLPPNALTEIQNINKRIENLGNVISSLERQKNKLSRWNVSGIDLYNKKIESLRQSMYEAKQAQLEVNNAIHNNDVNSLNSAYKRLANTIDKIDMDIRDNNSAQQQFNNNLNRGSKNATNLENTIRSMGNTLKMYAGMALSAFGLKQGAKVADEYVNLTARLGLLTKSQSEMKVFQEEIYKSAQKTGSVYSDMVNTTAKLGLLASSAFDNNMELNKFSELMAKSFKVSGASTQEQQAGMYQLTQAMASGRLQGDEFRSIIENAPMLAKAIQTYTGVSMQGLREMSKDGEISADIIKNSLFLAASEIEKKFSEMPKTFDWYFSEIKNAAIMEFSGIMQSINTTINTEQFNNFIQRIKSNLGSAAEWMLLKFYEFKVLLNELWSSAQPAFKALSNGFLNVRDYIFSTNGFLAQFIKTLSQLFSSAGFANIINSLSETFMIFGNNILIVTNFIVNLITNFDWLGGTVVKIIAFTRIFNTVNGIAQNIVRTLTSLVSMFTQRTQAQTMAVNLAANAQRGLNTAMTANPYGIVASAISMVISLMAMLSLKIDEVNAKAGNAVDYRGTHSLKVKDAKEKYGVDSTTAAQIVSAQDEANSEIEQIMKRKNDLQQKVYDTKKTLEKAKLNSFLATNGLPKYDPFGLNSNKNAAVTKAASRLDEATTNHNLATEELKKFENGDGARINEIQKGVDKKIQGLKLSYLVGSVAETSNKVVNGIQMQDLYNKINTLKPGDGAINSDKKKNVGTVDKIKDTVDVTSEDLRFMRDFAERDIINKIHTTQLAPQINVEFKGDSSNPFDVNEMIGRVADELANVVNNTAEGVHI